MPTAIKAKLQQKDTNLQGNTRGAPGSGDQGDCATGPYRTPTIRSLCQDQETQIYLVHRNEHRESAKMKRQRTTSPKEETIY